MERVEPRSTSFDSRFETLRAISVVVFLLVAAITYSRGLGANSFGASEAYSAMAAAKPGIVAIVTTPVREDPGKQVFYYVVLDGWSRIFGLGEAGLRSMSVAFAVVAILLVFALARELFDYDTALAAAAMWAFNPAIVLFAHRARMYPMLIVIALAHLLMFWRVRSRPTWPAIALCGVLGAALLYTHLASVLIIGAEVAMLARDYYLGRRNFGGWIAVLIAIALFAPYAPVAIFQSRELLTGHALDYVGVPNQSSILYKSAVILLAAAISLWLVFDASANPWRERIRWCAIWMLLPAIAFGAGSIVVRPMFNVRYIAPALAVSAIVMAALLSAAGNFLRNVVAGAITVTFLVVVVLYRPPAEPWREIARRIATESSSATPVFFESGFVERGAVPGSSVGGFASGYYAVPFSYYFSGANPREVVPGDDPPAARSEITDAAAHTGGAWLISWKDAVHAQRELPDPAQFTIQKTVYDPLIALYRIQPNRN